jgi:UDP-N-acetylglucosamine 4-epimerase
MTRYEDLQTELQATPRRWLVTGAAGFIGSNLVEVLLRLDQTVVGVDNFSTGRKGNLDEVKQAATATQWGRFAFIEGDIRDLKICSKLCRGADYVLHQAALGSVPRSIADPISAHANNVTGFLNMMVAARDNKVKRFIYASSSSVYGDHPALPKTEAAIGRPLSPYAATKYAGELYAGVFARCYQIETIGLRYFNVFGPRQDPDGPYAAVIPRWIAAMLRGEAVCINGDGETSRDFCCVQNVVQANLLAATTANPKAIDRVYNIAINQRTTLNELFSLIRSRLLTRAALPIPPAKHQPFRPGDVRHSQADITQAQEHLGYSPTHSLAQGLDEAMAWYVARSA